jgi:hypothetical protein
MLFKSTLAWHFFVVFFFSHQFNLYWSKKKVLTEIFAELFVILTFRVDSADVESTSALTEPTRSETSHLWLKAERDSTSTYSTWSETPRQLTQHGVRLNVNWAQTRKDLNLKYLSKVSQFFQYFVNYVLSSVNVESYSVWTSSTGSLTSHWIFIILFVLNEINQPRVKRTNKTISDSFRRLDLFKENSLDRSKWVLEQPETTWICYVLQIMCSDSTEPTQSDLWISWKNQLKDSKRI